MTDATAATQARDNLHHIAPIIQFLFAAGILGNALAFEYLGGLAPCALCIWQRWPYVVVLGLSALAVVAANRFPAVGAGLVALGGLGFAATAGIGLFHVGVEQHWWEGLAACGGTVSTGAASAADLVDQLMAAPVVRCDEIAWSFLGISMAGWNAILAGGLAIASVYAAWRIMTVRAA